jgi:predicted S18 family serine protease
MIAALSISALSSCAQQSEDKYLLLYQHFASQLSQKYSNKNLTGYNLFVQANENATDYPYYSYSTLMDCYRLLLWDDIINMTATMDNKTIYANLWNSTTTQLFTVTQKMNIITDTVAVEEWRILAADDIKNAQEKISKANEFFLQEDFFHAIQQLSNAQALLKNAENLLDFSMEKNHLSAMDNSDIENVTRSIAHEWMKAAEQTLNYTVSFMNRSGNLPQDLIDEAKALYKNGSYYQSLMKAAEAKTEAEYISNVPFFRNRSNALTLCQTTIEYVSLTMSKLYNEPTVDAPLAEENFEHAKLHLGDAEKEQDDGGCIAIASLSVQESLIAQQQALAALDINRVIKQNFHINNVDAQIPNQTIETNYTVFLISLVIIETIILLFIVFKKR